MKLLSHFEDYSHIIWDWNGTLLNDVDVAVSVMEKILQQHGLETLTKEKYKNLFQFPVRTYYEKLGFDFTKISFELICDQFIEHYNQGCLEAELFTDMHLVLSSLKSAGKQQSVLSAASQWHLEEITARFEVNHYFDHIFGVDNHYAASKLARGQELLKLNSHIPAKQTLLVGDTDHDLEVGQELGIDVLLIADGHQDFHRLTKKHHRVLSSRY